MRVYRIPYSTNVERVALALAHKSIPVDWVDVAVAIGDAIGADVPPRLRELVAKGALGRKTGSGLYNHEN